MNPDEKHETLKEREADLRQKLENVISTFEKSTGVWVTDFHYHKDCQVFSVTLNTGLTLAKGIR